MKQSLPTILVVDDNDTNLKIVGAVLEEAGYTPTFAFDGAAALEYARATPPDLVLLDVMMPGMDGYEVIRQLKADPALRGIPVIFLTARAGAEETVRGFEAGAADYVEKPFDSRELLARVSAQVELLLERRRAESYALELAQMNDKLVEALGKLEELATTDVLTGLPNRRYIMDRLGSEVDRSRRSGRGFCLGILDLDHFKLVNDSFGHEAGDLVLQAFGGLLRELLRGQDLAGRWGGEEFALVLPETGMAGALRLAGRVVQELRALRVPRPGAPEGDAGIAVTATVGLAEFRPAADDLDGLLRAADEALYSGKSAGRDRVVSLAPSADGAPPGAT